MGISREVFERVLGKGKGRRSGAKSRRNKYGVAPKEKRTVDGIVFDSRKEARRYLALRALREAGHVQYFLRQVPFDLPGPARWLADFLVVWSDGRITVEDVKGHRTSEYRLKKRQVEALYPIKIQEL